MTNNIEEIYGVRPIISWGKDVPGDTKLPPERVPRLWIGVGMTWERIARMVRGLFGR